ncbi:MAG: hypothetical protein QM767_01925 [Anaeromyxobacter sp.]
MPDAVATLLVAAELCQSYPLLSTNLLSEAMAIYVDAGQFPQAIELLDTADSWHAADLASLIAHPSRDGRRLGTVAGAALIQNGKRTAGLRAIEASLIQDIDQPSAFKVLVAAGSGESFNEALSVFDRVIRRVHCRRCPWRGRPNCFARPASWTPPRK